MSVFRELGLSEQVLRGVEKSGYTTPTPIQAKAIPLAISGSDLTGCAQTGTGKTAAFVLPMLSLLTINRDLGVGSNNNSNNDRNQNGGGRDRNDRRDGGRSNGQWRNNGRNGRNNRGPRRPVRALVVTPTRELAVQVETAVRTYGAFTGLRSIAVYGGVGMRPQEDAFYRGVDIVVATPGRLLDHLNRGNIDLSAVEILVIDEADRMFDMGFINDIRSIISNLPEERQTMLFSATMPPEVEKLASQIQQDPKLIEIGERRNPAESVTQRIYGIGQNQKIDLLLNLLETEESKSVVVFTRTKHRADQVATKLNKQGHSAVAIHSNRTQNQRQKALDGFKRGAFKILVATDIAARGIDVEGISHVFNFDTPNNPEDYIHRIGRTGRAEMTGEALTFVSGEETSLLRGIERFINRKIDQAHVDGLTSNIFSSSGSRSPRSGGYGNGGARKGGYRQGQSEWKGKKSHTGRKQNWSSSRDGSDRRETEPAGGDGRPRRKGNGGTNGNGSRSSFQGSDSSSRPRSKGSWRG